MWHYHWFRYGLRSVRLSRSVEVEECVFGMSVFVLAWFLLSISLYNRVSNEDVSIFYVPLSLYYFSAACIESPNGQVG